MVLQVSGTGGVLHYSNDRNGCVKVGMQTCCLSGQKGEYCIVEKFSERGQSLCGVCDGGERDRGPLLSEDFGVALVVVENEKGEGSIGGQFSPEM